MTAEVNCAATMLASARGLDFAPKAAWNKRKQIYEHHSLTSTACRGRGCATAPGNFARLIHGHTTGRGREPSTQPDPRQHRSARPYQKRNTPRRAARRTRSRHTYRHDPIRRVPLCVLARSGRAISQRIEPVPGLREARWRPPPSDSAIFVIGMRWITSGAEGRSIR